MLDVYLPSCPYAAKSLRPTYWTQGVAVENFLAKGKRAAPALGMWLEKSFLKKFQLSYPSTPNMATKLAESMPSRKNLSPIPGVVLSFLASG